MRKLHWYNDLQFEGIDNEMNPALDDSIIEGVEKVYSVSLPIEYKEIIKCHYGDSPLESQYSSNAEGELFGSIGVLLSLDPYSPENIFESSKEFPKKVIPFSEDGGGNFLCLDYRESEKPKIVLWHHEVEEELNYFFIAESFNTFIEGLYIPEDVIEDLSEQGVLPKELER